MLHGIRAWPDDQVRSPKRRTARPAQGLPHFDSMREHDGAKFSEACSHRPHYGRQVRMESNHQPWFAARRAQRSEQELRFAARVAGNRKLTGTNTHGMEPLRIVKAQEPARNPALGGKLRSHSGNVAPGPLHATG